MARQNFESGLYIVTSLLDSLPLHAGIRTRVHSNKGAAEALVTLSYSHGQLSTFTCRLSRRVSLIPQLLAHWNVHDSRALQFP